MVAGCDLLSSALGFFFLLFSLLSFSIDHRPEFWAANQRRRLEAASGADTFLITYSSFSSAGLHSKCVGEHESFYLSITCDPSAFQVGSAFPPPPTANSRVPFTCCPSSAALALAVANLLPSWLFSNTSPSVCYLNVCVSGVSHHI